MQLFYLQIKLIEYGLFRNIAKKMLAISVWLYFENSMDWDKKSYAQNKMK